MLLFQKLRCVASVTPTFLPHSLIRKATLQWGNLQEVRKTGLHCSNIYFVCFKIGSVYSITASLQWKFLNFDGVLQRFPLITQANSQVCFRWMSKCDLNSIRKVWSGINCYILPSKTINELKFLMTYPSFSNYFSRTSLAIALKVYLLVKEKQYCCSVHWKCRNFSMRLCLQRRRKFSDVSEFQVKNSIILRLRHRKPIF